MRNKQQRNGAVKPEFGGKSGFCQINSTIFCKPIHKRSAFSLCAERPAPMGSRSVSLSAFISVKTPALSLTEAFVLSLSKQFILSEVEVKNTPTPRKNLLYFNRQPKQEAKQ